MVTKPVEIWKVFSTNYDGAPVDLLAVYLTEEQADAHAHEGMFMTVVEGFGLRRGSGSVYLLETDKPVRIGANLRKREESAREKALKKLTKEERRALDLEDEDDDG